MDKRLGWHRPRNEKAQRDGWAAIPERRPEEETVGMVLASVGLTHGSPLCVVAGDVGPGFVQLNCAGQ